MIKQYFHQYPKPKYLSLIQSKSIIKKGEKKIIKTHNKKLVLKKPDTKFKLTQIKLIEQLKINYQNVKLLK